MDLALAANNAAASPDPDRALDQLLTVLPSDVLQPPQLKAEPARINLGQLKPGADSQFDLVLANQGMRLLFGAVASDSDWLALGEGGSHVQKVFQTPTEISIPVHVVGTKLRAQPKAFEGRLCVDSNGGSMIVVVSAEVTARPFPTGALAGAMSPRELAVKAKANPQEAAALFEQGLAEKWYQDNGWTYPVQGPAGSGLGAVQQFFEALGLVKPPKVEVSDVAIHFRGSPGQELKHSLKVGTQEKRPVFAHGWSDRPWLSVGQPEFRGSQVKLPLSLAVPPRPGETLEAKVTVRANGNQRFVVAVTLQVDQVQVAVPVAEEAIPVLYSAEPAPAPAPRPRTRKATAVPAATVATFGMVRRVYWTGLVGGWSAFVGWLLAEFTVGWWVSKHILLAVLMSMLVGSVLGAGLSQVEALLTGQWKNQLPRLGLGALGGLVGGLVGGLFGNLLFQLLEGIVILGFLGRVVGWTLLGLAVGSCEGLLRRQWRQARNGLIGGSIGGFLGGLFFDLVRYLIGSPVSSRAFAFVLLGLFIGLSLGLVQVLLKEAWLTVEEGFRAGRQIILDQEVTTMGTSEKAGLIFIAYGAKGVDPVHLRIRRLQGGSYVLEDNRSRSGTFLNGEAVGGPTQLEDGDLIQFGVNKVRFNERFRPREKSLRGR
jgi:hypothetical protein